MLSLNRIFHNSPDLPLIRRELMLITARCGLTGAMQVSSKMDRSMLVLVDFCAARNSLHGW